MFETVLIYNNGHKEYKPISGELRQEHIWPIYTKHNLPTCYNNYYYVEEIKIGCGVTSINEDCFYYTGLNLRKITIPPSLKDKTIKSGLFEGCCDLEEVVISEGIEKIERGCFCICENLKNVVIPSSMKYIDEDSFGLCGKLNQISKNEINKVIKKQKILELVNKENETNEIH